MATTRTLIKSGDGNATAALVAGTVSNVAVVTLPSDPGYEYTVKISVMLKNAAAAVSYTAVAFGNSGARAYFTATANIVTSANVAGDDTVTNVNSMNNSPVDYGDTVMTQKSGPGTAITCGIISNAANTYYLHYSYIGRKVITESF